MAVDITGMVEDVQFSTVIYDRIYPIALRTDHIDRNLCLEALKKLHQRRIQMLSIQSFCELLESSLQNTHVI